MGRSSASAVLAPALCAFIVAPAIAQEDQPLEGAWIVVTTEVPGKSVDTTPRPGMLLFTGTHYSFMLEAKRSARPAADHAPGGTDPGKILYESVADCGRYRVEGDTIITRPLVMVVPEGSNAWPAGGERWTYRIDGDSLWLLNPDDGVSLTLGRR